MNHNTPNPLNIIPKENRNGLHVSYQIGILAELQIEFVSMIC